MARPPLRFKRKGVKYAKSSSKKSRTPKELQYLIALRDPFHPKAYGARIPDSNTVPSQSFYALDSWVMTSTSNGCGFMVIPNLFYLGARTSGVSPATWTWGAAFTTNNIGNASIYNNAVANYAGIRRVASGIKITAIPNVTAAEGTVHYCYGALSNFSAATWQGPTAISQMQRMNGYDRVPLSQLTQKPLVLVNKPMDVTSQRYTDPVDTGVDVGGEGSFDFANQWCAIFVFYEATNTNAVMEVTALTHYEGIVATNSAGIVPTGTDSEPYRPNVLGAAAHSMADSGLKINEDAEWDKIAVAALDAFEGLTIGAAAGYSRYGVPGAVAGGLYGAGRGYYQGRGVKRAHAQATSSTTYKRPMLKY